MSNCNAGANFFWSYVLCLDELGETVGKGTFGKVVECKDLNRYVRTTKFFFPLMESLE